MIFPHRGNLDIIYESKDVFGFFKAFEKNCQMPLL
jgi:hypothetical protein